MSRRNNFYAVHAVLAIVLSTILTGCSDVVHTFYLDAASAQSGIAKGWVPACLPPGASEISETHDLDLNTGHGSFTFSQADAQQLRGKLKEYNADQKLRTAASRSKYENLGFQFYSYGEFDLAVDWKTRKAEFWLSRP
ncbi:MAG: hypothetical protein ACXW3Z_08340 [Limisphaerales bacterium]